MIKAYYMPIKSLTRQLVSKESCGPTHHNNCVTNADWCNAECAEQNAARGHETFVVCTDGRGLVWVAIKDKLPANWTTGTIGGVHD